MRGTGSKGFARVGAVFVAAALALACFAAGAQAKTHSRLDGVQLAGGGSKWKLLVSMNLPLEISGTTVHGRVTVDLPDRSWSGRWDAVVHSGPLRQADQRSFFPFVAGMKIPAEMGRLLTRRGPRATARASISYMQPAVRRDVDRGAGSSVVQDGIRRAKPGRCETLPRLMLESPASKSRRAEYPVCGRTLKWRVVRDGESGHAVAGSRNLAYRRIPGQTGA
ncbi:MAG TPA: hypothetical protein PLD65_09355, partial [Solirubrobacterales bacterium]|nr:hypothetical protein [Solirubrobacterales bacterium]